jgi:hypothetical protein
LVRECLDALEAFEKRLERICDKKIMFRHEMTKLIRQAIGKKRVEKLGLLQIQQGSRNCMELLEDVIMHSYCKLPSKQMDDLSHAYYEFICTCANAEAVEEGGNKDEVEE